VPYKNNFSKRFVNMDKEEYNINKEKKRQVAAAEQEIKTNARKAKLAEKLRQNLKRRKGVKT
jgi:hypothetical protein